MELNFTPFPVIQTERLRLRKLINDDAKEIFFLRSDEQVMRYIDRVPAKNEDDAIKHIEEINGFVAKNECVYWGITALPSDKVIGTVCLWKMDKESFRCEVGYALHPDYHRKGIMTETLKAVLDFAFNDLRFHSITADVNPANDASKSLLESLGFKQEAYFRESYYFDGKFLDSAVYCIISPV